MNFKKNYILIIILIIIFVSFNLFADNKKNIVSKKRDPFIALVDKEGKIRSLEDLFTPADGALPIKIELKGILLGKKEPLAIINDKVFKEDSQIVEGLILKKINPDNIVLDYRGKKAIIEIRKKEKK